MINIDKKKLDVAHIINSYKEDPRYPTARDFLYDIIVYMNNNKINKISKDKINDLFKNVDNNMIDKLINEAISENILGITDDNFFIVENNIFN